MKRNFKLTFALGVVALALALSPFLNVAASAQIVEPNFDETSDYQVCMDYCMPEHNFDYCHGRCGGLVVVEGPAQQ